MEVAPTVGVTLEEAEKEVETVVEKVACMEAEEVPVPIELPTSIEG